MSRLILADSTWFFETFSSLSIKEDWFFDKQKVYTERKDKILFIEDLDEYLYHIDRMMMNLRRNGCIENLKGILVGGMTKMKDNEIPWGKNALEIVQDVTKKLNIPMIFNFPAGHIRDNRALVLGNNVTIDVTENCSTVVFE